ncbi:uncharacterized protein LOC142322889 isoform X2 [Lycorma delicatula]|uniref:uncharacterized protein LOC142322889 isoform X2 n=1 Tax=Lycorma delicatula TaxID=130591 RepID=UPI003F5118A1
MQLSSTATSGVANMYSFPSHPAQPIIPQEDEIGTSRAVSQLILELESQAVTNKSFTHHNHQIDPCPDTTELCLPASCDGQSENSALDSSIENRMRSGTTETTENSDDTNTLYRSTKF